MKQSTNPTIWANPMLARTVVALTLSAAAFAIPAQAGPKPDNVQKECPHALGDFDKITEDIAKAPTCTVGLKLASSCQVVASSDVQLGAAVQERCERDFLTKLRRDQKRAYHGEHKRCERKYIKEQGSMYRSFEA